MNEAVQMEFVLEKPLPSNPDAERVILGAILLDGNLMEQALRLSLDDFYSPRHRQIFRAMETLYLKGEEINPILINEELKRAGTIQVPILDITNLSFGLPHFDDISVYIRLVKQKSVARRLIQVCQLTLSECLSEDEDIQNVIDRGENRILELSNENLGASVEQGFVPLARIVPAIEQQFVNYHEGITNGVKTGMKELDQKLDGGGLQPGGLYIIGAGEKVGKTSLALDWMYDVSFVQGLSSVIVTREMTKETLAKRLYSQHTGIPYGLFRPGFTGSRFEQALKELPGFGQIPISIADKIRTVPQLRRHLKRAISDGKRIGKPVGLGVVDYLQLMELDEMEYNKSDSRTTVVSQVSRDLKSLANELEIPLVVMSNLNRLGLGEGDRPDAHNLRESQQIAFDAEALFFLHNPAYKPGVKYVPQEITPIDFIISRQRNGPTGDIRLYFIGPYMTFMTEEKYQQYLKKTGGGHDAFVPTVKEITSIEDIEF